MKRRLVVGALMLLVTPLAGQTAAPPKARLKPLPVSYKSAIAQATKLITDTMAALKVPGSAIGVMKDGKLVWSAGFGYADLEQQVKAGPKTIFRAGSISKSLTSAAIGRLIEEGKLDLDQPVQRYVPSFPRKQWPITVRQVAGHIAGIRHYNPGEFESTRHYPTVLEGLMIFQDDSLLFEPGTRYSYSSYGWNLVSAVIEGASGEPFLDYMRKQVFLKAGMLATVPDYADSIIPWRARNYVRGPDRQVLNAPYVDNSYKWAAGGFLSTIEDLVRFGEAMRTGTLLKPATVQQLWTSLTLSDGKETGYGIGWSVNRDAQGHRYVGHTGGSMGATSHLRVYPDDGLVIVLLVNSDPTFISALPRIATLFYSAK
jgi:CubicO group peptidase (beta-lactamase class C family)